MVDSEAPITTCPKCKSSEIVDTMELDGKSYPYGIRTGCSAWTLVGVPFREHDVLRLAPVALELVDIDVQAQTTATLRRLRLRLHRFLADESDSDTGWPMQARAVLAGREAGVLRS